MISYYEIYIFGFSAKMWHDVMVPLSGAISFNTYKNNISYNIKHVL